MNTTQQEIDQIIHVCENWNSSQDVCHDSKVKETEPKETAETAETLNTLNSAIDGIHEMDHLHYRLLMNQGLLKFIFIVLFIMSYYFTEAIIKSKYLETKLEKMMDNIINVDSRIEMELEKMKEYNINMDLINQTELNEKNKAIG